MKAIYMLAKVCNAVNGIILAMKRVVIGFLLFIVISGVVAVSFFVGMLFNNILSNRQTYDSLSLINLVNEGRVSNGLQPLYIDQTLCDIASERREYLVSRNQWSHDGLEQFTRSQNKFHLVGENLAKGYSSDKDVYLSWQLSPTHNQNMNNSRFEAGCISMDYEYIVFFMGGY